VNAAREIGKTIRVVGALHSPSDIYCTSEWMISLEHLNSVLAHDLDNRTITIQAGMLLMNYCRELEKRGWCMDNLGSIAEQSVAGAISTCTHGSSLYYGVLSCQVLFVSILSLKLGSRDYVSISGRKCDDMFPELRFRSIPSGSVFPRLSRNYSSS
jgi:FAD/FMN-containing dehydrogenase